MTKYCHFSSKNTLITHQYCLIPKKMKETFEFMFVKLMKPLDYFKTFKTKAAVSKKYH